MRGVAGGSQARETMRLQVLNMVPRAKPDKPFGYPARPGLRVTWLAVLGGQAGQSVWVFRADIGEGWFLN